MTVDSSTKIIDASARTKAVKITGNKLANTISGGSKNDTIYGGKGNDSLVGNAGNDIIYGQDGNDTLWGGAGNDTLTGGKGNDLFVYGAGKDVIADYATGDKISFGAAISKSTIKGSNVVFTIGKGSLIVQKAKGKTLSLIDSTGKEYSTVVGGTTLTLTNDKETSVKVNSSVKIVDASKRKTAVAITGNKLANIIRGGSKNDTIYGGKGNDSLVGNAGNDYLYGDKGNDTLWGGVGNDSLYGGDGKDIFIYKPGEGTDRIFDYSSGDMLTILKKNGKTGGIFTKSSFSGDDLTLTISGGGKVIFDGVSNGDQFNINGKTYTLSGKKLK